MGKYPDHSKEGKFFGDANEPLNQANFERFKAEFGDEHAKGYLKAISDFQQEIGIALGAWRNNDDGNCNSAVVVKKYIEKLFDHNLDFLNSINNNSPINKPDELLL